MESLKQNYLYVKLLQLPYDVKKDICVWHNRTRPISSQISTVRLKHGMRQLYSVSLNVEALPHKIHALLPWDDKYVRYPHNLARKLRLWKVFISCMNEGFLGVETGQVSGFIVHDVWVTNVSSSNSEVELLYGSG